MAVVVVGTKELAGVEVSVEADTIGRFYIRSNDENHDLLGDGLTLEQAEQKARTALAKRKVKVSVPFITEKNGTVGTATSRRAGRGRKVMVTVDGKSEQWDGTMRVLRGNIPEDIRDRFFELANQIGKLAQEQNEIKRDWEIRIGEAVDKAIEVELAKNDAGS